MTRWAIRICVFLVLGAIVNVAVAWAAFLAGVPTGSAYLDSSTISPIIRTHFGDDFAQPADGFVGQVFHGIGGKRVFCMAKPMGGPTLSVDVLDGGWPMFSLHGETICRFGSVRSSCILSLRASGSGDLPYQPIWPGFAINTVFYAALLWLLFAGPFVLRRRRRIRRGLCPKCAYDLRGRRGGPEAAACPECGAAVGQVR